MRLFRKRLTEPVIDDAKLSDNMWRASSSRIVEQELYGGDVVYIIQDKWIGGVWENAFPDERTFASLDKAVAEKTAMDKRLMLNKVISERVVG